MKTLNAGNETPKEPNSIENYGKRKNIDAWTSTFGLSFASNIKFDEETSEHCVFSSIGGKSN